MRTTWFGIVTDCAIGIVALDAISPMITSTCSPTSLRAASTDAAACDWPSCESTSCTLILFESPSDLSAAFCTLSASCTALSMFPPYAARSPVNGRTSPIFNVNEQFDAVAVDALPLRAAETPAATSAIAAIASAASAALTLTDWRTFDSSLRAAWRRLPAAKPAPSGSAVQERNKLRVMAVTKARKSPPFEQFMAYRRFSGALAFSPDGSQLYFVSNMSGQFNLWSVGIEGGWPTQLTAFTEDTVRTLGVSPRDGTIAFCADHDGDEFHQLYLLDPDHGWPEKLTDAPQVQHFVGGDAFSPDGTQLAYAANARTPTDMEVWVRDLASGETRSLFGEGMFAVPGPWSPDGTKLVINELRSNSDLSLHLFDLESGVATEVTPHTEEGIYAAGPWKPDGSGFYFLSDEGREFRGLAFYDVASGSYEWVETPEHDLEEVAASADGRILAWLVNEDGYERLRLRDTATGDDLPAPELPDGARPHLTGFQPPLALARDGSRGAVILSGPRQPPDAYVFEIDDGTSHAVTQSWIGGGFGAEELGEVELISYPTFDGRDIPAWLYRPRDTSAAVPAVLAIHGGPEAQERPVYSPLYQYLVSRGIAVLATNIRGSTGYGKSYQRLIHRDWGGGDLKDWDHAAQWLRAQDWIDADRIGV